MSSDQHSSTQIHSQFLAPGIRQEFHHQGRMWIHLRLCPRGSLLRWARGHNASAGASRGPHRAQRVKCRVPHRARRVKCRVRRKEGWQDCSKGWRRACQATRATDPWQHSLHPSISCLHPPAISYLHLKCIWWVRGTPRIRHGGWLQSNKQIWSLDG